jgi:hypothetical protein
MNYMLKEGFDKDEALPALMTRNEWEAVARSIADDPALGGLVIIKHINDEKTGHRAFCFSDGGNAAYVVFRGTCGDEEWLDNGRGMFTTETPAQKAALDFALEVSALPNVHFLCVAGHSKGGNKAQYCAIAGGGIVDRCVSVDGQGFSRLFFDKYNGIIEKYRYKITAIAERRDFVNCLGFYLKPPDYYSGGRGKPNGELPHGAPLPYFHCPDALRLNADITGEPAPVSYISEMLNSFVVYYLTDSKYERKREETVMGLVSLMTSDRGGIKGIEAIAEAALAFFELAAKSSDFRMELRDVLFNEKNLIAATAEMTETNHMGSGEISDKAIKHFAETVLRHPAHFRCFIKCAERFVRFVQKTQEVREQAAHVNHFIKRIFKHIEELKGRKNVRQKHSL